MKAIVHIGAPKTGSSSIQSFLFANRQVLATRGFRYHRKVASRGSQWEYPLAVLAENRRLLRGETERARYRARTVEEARTAYRPFLEALGDFRTRWPEPVALFSSEHILPWLNAPKLVKDFDTRFRAAFSDVRYVAYFRAPGDVVLSQYSERIKRGDTPTLAEFVARRVRGLDLLKPARRWVNSIGHNRVDIRLFDRSAFEGGDLLTDFCAACGIDPEGLQCPPRENQALTAPGAECLRMLNQMVPELRPDGSHNPLRAELLDHIAALSADQPKLRLTTRQHHMIDRHLGERMEQFRAEFFPTRDPLFSQTMPQFKPPKLGEIRNQALSIMAQLLVKTRMGEIRTLNFFQRQRAYRLDPTVETANTAVAPNAPAKQNDQTRRKT